MMQLTIKIAESCPINAKPPRRVVAVLPFELHTVDSQSSYILAPTSVGAGDNFSLVIEGAYTPCNHILSILMQYQIGTVTTHLFDCLTEFGTVPTCFVIRLPTEQFVELSMLPTGNG